MNSPLYLIIRREYLERVKRKSFIWSTILVPLLMIALMAVPVLIQIFSTPTQRQVAVIDSTGVLYRHIEQREADTRSNTVFVDRSDSSVADARADEDNDVIVVIGPDAVSNPASQITVYTRESLPIEVDGYITGRLRRAVEDERLDAYDIGDVRAIIAETECNDSFRTFRIGEEEASDSSTSSAVSYVVGLVCMMMLYMFILMYGQMVMNSIVDEKSNRVLELIVSSVKPKTLMIGKITGIGLVAITQILIWAAIMLVCSLWGIPVIGHSLSAAATADPELTSAMEMLANPWNVVGMTAAMLAFFIGGYLFYSTMYAAVASACDNIQDAGQLATIPTIPVIIGIIVSMSAFADPNSTMAIWCSYIPFTSPMVMMARLPFDVPLWQILTSLAVLYASFLLMIWVCAKIYRVGIFMYGKKPTFMEIIKWSRYK